MKGNVNPFEPWRPVEARIPQPIHASRPWRPPPPPPVRPTVEEPPFVEPVKAPPPNKPSVLPPQPQRRQCRTGQPSAGRTPISQLAAFGVLTVLALICLDEVGWLCGAHLPRLLGLGLSGGMFVAMSFASPRRNWYRRLRGMAIALTLAGITLWFIPTVHGVSLWSAYRQVEELRALPAGDIAGYQSRTARCRLLIEEFPSFASDIRAAKQAWLRRTVDEAIENADRQLETDPHAAFAHLHRLNTELARLEHYPSVQKELESARGRAMQACAKEVQREVKNGHVGQP
jgi:hypothetical protein